MLILIIWYEKIIMERERERERESFQNHEQERECIIFLGPKDASANVAIFMSAPKIWIKAMIY